MNHIKKLSLVILCLGVFEGGLVHAQSQAEKSGSGSGNPAIQKPQSASKNADAQWMKDMQKQMASMQKMHMQMMAPGNPEERHSLMLEQQNMMQQSMNMMRANNGAVNQPSSMMGDSGKNQQMMEMRMQMMESMMQMMMDRMSVSPK